jgi:hypothetical protein
LETFLTVVPHFHRLIQSGKTACPNQVYPEQKVMDSATARLNIGAMEDLSKFIEARLSERTSCTLFESQLAPVWPDRRKEDVARIAAIQSFAKRKGWVAIINDPGIRVTFKKLDS